MMDSDRQTAPALSDLKHAGDMLANCAFNLAQDGALSERERETLTQCRKAWDDARKADRAQQGVNPTMTREELVAAAESIGMRFAVFSGSFGDQPSPSRADREQRPAELSEVSDADILHFQRSNGWGGMSEEQATLALARWAISADRKKNGADRDRAITGKPVAPIPEGFSVVLVKNFGDLMDALDRADRKGYMPDAMAEEWEAFDWRAAPITGEPFGWFYELTPTNEKAGPIWLGSKEKRVTDFAASDEGRKSFPLYGPITGETSRDVAAEGGSPAPSQSTRDTPLCRYCNKPAIGWSEEAAKRGNRQMPGGIEFHCRQAAD